MLLQSMELEGLSGREAGRKLLSKMYRAFTGEEMPPIFVTDRGKPYFAGSAIHFSISHTKRRVFCVLSDRSVGIDAEEIDRAVNLSLAEKVLSPTEFSQFERAEDKRLALLTFWVLKEASAKRTGQGVGFHPTDTAFSLADPRVQILDNCLVAVVR